VPKIVGFLGGFPGNFWAVFRQLLCGFCVSDLATLVSAPDQHHQIQDSCRNEESFSTALSIYNLGMWRIPNSNPTESDTFSKIRNPSDT